MPDFRDYAHGKGTAMFLAHSGKGHDDNPPGRGSGRYPFGSGSNPYQRNNEKYYSKINKLNRKINKNDRTILKNEQAKNKMYSKMYKSGRDLLNPLEINKRAKLDQSTEKAEKKNAHLQNKVDRYGRKIEKNNNKLIKEQQAQEAIQAINKKMQLEGTLDNGIPKDNEEKNKIKENALYYLSDMPNEPKKSKELYNKFVNEGNIDLDKVADDFYNNHELYVQYAKKAAKINYDDYMKNRYDPKRDPEPKLENWEYGYIYSDADQGANNSFLLYLQDNADDIVKKYK